MARNVEIKARIARGQFQKVRSRAEAIADVGPIVLEQTDTFFQTQSGRLKLREFADGTAELIHYERPDCEGPKTSDYIRSMGVDPKSLKPLLERSNGILGVVKKHRDVFIVQSEHEHTRIHLDQVEGLGEFLELEVVLGDGSDVEGEAIATRLLNDLQIDSSQLVAGAYFDLMTVDA